MLVAVGQSEAGRTQKKSSVESSKLDRHICKREFWPLYGAEQPMRDGN